MNTFHTVRLEGEVVWKTSPSVAVLAGKPIRLRIQMNDADFFAMRFA